MTRLINLSDYLKTILSQPTLTSKEIQSMNITKFMICTCIAVVLGFGLVAVSDIPASDDATEKEKASTSNQPGELYLASDDPMADLATLLESARRNNKLALVVMGANWCHDSRALASRLQQEPLSSVADENYETLFVDVGYLEKGKDVITSLGLPVYYATPTVLIIDPVSGQLINANNRHQWANAYSISMTDSVEYFQQMARLGPASIQSQKEPGEDLQTLMMEIDAFEQLQADRLYQAYAILGPMLKAYKEGEKEAFSDEYWNAVRDFRYQVPADVDSLRAGVRERVAAGEIKISLDYPQYQAFPWEQ